MAKGDVLVRMKADVGNYNANLAAASRTLKNFRDENLTLGGVVKNMTRSFTGYAAGLMSIGALAGKLHETVTEAVQLAKSAEGVRLAFNRLNDPSILDGLRQATHGTVTDVELMKAAVKFNDFKLPLDQLGTMLAFAQQKAKDTGESVDFMVESITNGLGRQSKPILDNLGISAKEIETRMKSTGDFTKAVGEIIREQMAKAGDYVETAADRAAQANVSLQNKMEELGRKFAPVEEASNQLWTSMKIGILDIVGGPLARLLNGLTEAGRIKNMLSNMNGEQGSGNTVVDQQLKKLQAIRKAGGSNYYFNTTLSGMLEDYNRQIMALDAQIKNGGKKPGAGPGESQDVRYLQLQMKALGVMRDQLAAGAREITNSTPAITTPVVQPIKPTKTIKEEKDDFEEIIGLIPNAEEAVKSLQQQIRESMDEDEIAKLVVKLREAEKELQRLNDLGKPIEIATGTSIQNEAGMSAYINSIKQQLETADYGTSLYNGLSATLTDMTTLHNLVGESLKAGLGTVMFDVADETGKDFWTRAMEGGVEDIDWKTIVDKINEARKTAGLDAISLDFNTGSVGSGSSDKGKKNNRYLSKNEEGKTELKLSDAVGGIASGIGSMTSSLEQLGIELPQGMKDVLGGIQAVTTILSGISTIVLAIEAISSADAIIPFANGGVVKAASGYRVPGRTFSGDLVPARLNAGELVLNQAQAGVIANALQDRDFSGGVSLQPYVEGERIYLGVENTLKRKGKGEIVTTSTLRRLGIM